MRGKKPGEKLSDNPNAKRKRAARARAARARAAEESELEPDEQPADPPEDTSSGSAEPEAPEPERTTAQLGVPEILPEDGPPVGPPPGLSVKPTSPSSPSSPRPSSSSGARDSAWHRKWRAQLAGGGGREQTAEWTADKLVGVLSKLDDITRQCGQDPMVTAESLRPAIVLTVDQLLPERVADALDKPSVHLALGVLAMAGQTMGAVTAAKARVKRGEAPLPPKGKAHLKSVPPDPAPEPPKVVPVTQAPRTPANEVSVPACLLCGRIGHTHDACPVKSGPASAPPHTPIERELAARLPIPAVKLGDPDVPSF